MNNKEYGVKLDIDISKFTEKLKSAETYTNTVMQKIKDSIKEPLEEVGDTTKSAFEEKIGTIAKLGEEMGSLTMEYASAVLQEGENSKSALDLKDKIRSLNAEMEKESDELGKVGDAMSRLLEDETEATEETKKFSINLSELFNRAKEGSDNLGKTIDRSLKKGITNIKRFSLSLIGIQSAYSMITKAVNSYMAYDTQMATKIKANWVALGAMFAPIVEKLIGLFQKLVAYVNVFWKAFTGKNLIDMALKKVQKTANKTTKSVKELNKELANIDEITNLNFDQSGGDIDAGAGEEYNIEDALNELKNLKLDPKFVEIMTWLGEKAKDLWKWFEKIGKKFKDWGINLEDVISIAGSLYGAFEFAKIFGQIEKIIGVSGGATGLYGMLTVFGMLVDFQLAYKLGQEFSDLVDAWWDAKDAMEDYGANQVNLLNKNKEKIEENNKKLKDGNLSEEERKRLIQQNSDLVEDSSRIYEDYLTRLKKGKKYTKEQREEIEKQTTAIEKVSGKTYKTTIKAIVEEEFKRNSFLYKLINGTLPEFHFSGGGGSGVHFAKGNVAYEPTMAQFGEYAGARSNPEITAPQNMIRQTLSEALVDALPQIKGNGGGDTILYVNGKELARATYQDFQNEKNRLGSSNVAIRRS